MTNENLLANDLEIEKDEVVIVDDIDTEEDQDYYYDSTKEIDIQEQSFTIFEWMRKYKNKQLVIDPEYQRNLVWTQKQKSEFIESILLNIPLPLLYVNQDRKGRYIIVDGLQRTTTLAGFILGEDTEKKDIKFKLTGLKVLKNLNGKFFSDLPLELQTRIEDRKMLVYIIKPSVPIQMVYNIFRRINTNGTQLNRQEIRNSLYDVGSANKFLKYLSEQDYFRQAVDNGISPKRMKDREAVLRYLAFQILDYQQMYQNMDNFLEEALKKLHRLDQNSILHLETDFKRVMNLTYSFFGKSNFRLPTPDGRRGSINMALLESVSNFFAKSSDDFITKYQEQIKINYQELLNNQDYLDSIQHSTGDKSRVLRRFFLAQEILGDINKNA